MPVKDLTGPPRPTAEQEALIVELHRRMGKPLPKRRGFRDDGELDPTPTSSGPKPSPMTGGAAAEVE